MHRLWFRLDSVLPLAEHAMACFTHRLTFANGLALPPAGPALVWQSNPMMDLLTSNGVPFWHNTNGVDQAAEAHTWRDSSGQFGTAWTSDYQTAYLPLTADDGSSGPVLDQLRGARFNGNSWVSIDIDPTDAHLINPDRVRVLPGRHDLVPAATTWTPAQVTCPTVASRAYPALIADCYTSDSGALLARFDKQTIMTMAADLDSIYADPDSSDPMPGTYPLLRLRGDVLTVLDEHVRPLYPADRFRATDHLTPDREGLYPLGAYLWPWQHVLPGRRPER